MRDHRRLPAAPPADTGRDARAEALLVDGLHHYFNGRFEDAIHVWTRVLFLDRSHARARAYIDRARTAIAERQRLADEMLAASTDRLTQGDAAEARRILAAVVDTTGTDERAEALRSRIERLERAGSTAVLSPSRDGGEVAPLADVRRSAAWRRPATIAVAFVVIVLAVLIAPMVSEWLGFGSPAVTLETTGSPVPRTVLSSSEVALVRARTLYARGRLAEALRALDRVTDGADQISVGQLRTEIQQTLLATRASAARGGGGRAASAGRE
jgi:hypothetical protein